MSFETCDIMGVPFAKTDYDEASEFIVVAASNFRSVGVFALPVHGLVEYWDNPAMKEAVDKAGLICPDGQPIRWLMNRIYGAGLKDRVYGPTLTLKVLEKCNAHGLGVFLYGGATEHILTGFCEFVTSRFPNIRICGMYRENNAWENTLDAEEVNRSGANLVLVGRGCPRQEIWISDQIGKIQAPMMAVGAAFSFHSGAVRQAPAWMQGIGLEWLYRLMQEPGRLWRRYLYTNAKFLVRAIPIYLGKRSK